MVPLFSAFSFNEGRVKPLKNFFVILPNNLYPGRYELARKVRNSVSTESCMLKLETV